ncbi:hypothetical protein TNCV_5082921 [Trichonephila clavipes]|nr:hypothetical protein TNCV_5082921 [Trichonephila clavipes]
MLRRLKFNEVIDGENIMSVRRQGGVVDLSLAFCTQGCGFDPGRIRCIFVRQKIDSVHVVRIIRAKVNPSEGGNGVKITCGNWYHLYGAALNSDTSSWECTGSAMVKTLHSSSPIG